MWNGKPYYSLDYYLKETFGEKVYKLSLNAGMTCPNRDGTLGYKGCIFCSEGGSGDFAASRTLSITEQIEAAKERIRHKHSGNQYIAYFQAYTNTYAPVSYLSRIYREAITHPEITALSIATRPDCLENDVLELLEKLNCIKPVWIELGLQTIHPKSASFIRRGYELPCFENAVAELKKRNITVIVHTILGLPTETAADMLETISYLSAVPIDGIKLQLLHILKETDLADYFMKTNFSVFTLKEYVDLLISCIELLPPHIVIHRLTGDGPKDLLIAPMWSKNKRMVLNTIHKEFKSRNTWQGKNAKEVSHVRIINTL